MDEKARRLEQQAAQGDNDSMDRLKREWLRSQIFHSCPDCKASVPGGVWGEDQAECGIPKRAPSGIPVVQLPSGPAIASRPRKNPLYDHCMVRAVEGLPARVDFFLGRKPIWESNADTLGSMNRFYWYGISLIPDARARPEDVALIYDTGLLSVEFMTTKLLELPGRVVMDDMPTIETQEGEEFQQRFAWEAGEILDPDPRFVRLRNEGPVRNVTISNRPIEITDMSHVRFSLQVEKGLQEDTGVMLVLFGVLLRNITG